MNERYLPYPGAPTQWFSQRWPQAGTGSRPALLLEQVGTTPGIWSSLGTGLGINAPAGFTGNLLDLQAGGNRYFATGKNSSGFPYTVICPSFANGTPTGEVTWQTSNFGHTLSLSGLAGGGYTLTITNQDTNSNIVLATTGSFSIGNLSSRPSIFGEANNTLAQRNGTNPQIYRIYNTVTGTGNTNYERAYLGWANNVFQIGVDSAGTGLPRQLEFQTNATTRVAITTTGSVGIGSTIPQTTLDVSGALQASDFRITSSSEKTTLVSGNTVSLVYNTGGGNVAICTNPTGPITLNVTGIPTDSTFDSRMITFSVVAIQTSIGYACTAIALNGVTKTIKYPGGVVSTASTSSYDIFNLTGINTVGSASTTANYDVLGIVNGNFK